MPAGRQVVPHAVAWFCLIVGSAGAGGLHEEQQWRSLKENNWPNRYEGLAPELNALRKYDVRGIFAADNVSVVNSKTGQLTVAFYVPAGDRVSLFLTRELQPLTHYRMEPKLSNTWPNFGAWNVFSHWPVADVLVPNNIKPSDLGIVIELRDPRTPDMFAPALFYSDDDKPAKVDEYSIFLLSDVAVERLRCTVRDQDGNTRAGGFSYSCDVPKNGQMPGSTTAAFRVHAAHLPRGLVTVNISGEYPGDESGSRLNAEIHFFREPNVPF